MTSHCFKTFLFLCCLIIFNGQVIADCKSTPPQSLEETGRLINSFGDWGVYRIDKKNTCWIASKPSKTTLAQKEIAEGFCRSSPMFYVLLTNYNPKGEPSFKAGVMLPSKPVAALETDIGKFRLSIVSSDHAWAFKEHDQKIIQDLALSKMVKVTFETVDGVTATDNFSTNGFTLALDEAKARCGVVDFVS